MDISKIRVGDEVTVRAKVVRRWADDNVSVRIGSGGSFFAHVEGIATHTPASRPIVVGSKVRAANGLGAYTVLALHGEFAWLQRLNGIGACTHRLGTLTLADEDASC